METKVRAALAALQVAIQTERDGYQFYQEAATRIHDPQGQELFRALARDELVHESILQSRVAELERQSRWLPLAPAELPPTALPAPGIPIFSRERLTRDVQAYTTELSALRMAYLLEHDAVTLYRRAAQETDDPAGKALYEALVEMELGHQRILENEYQVLSDQFKLDMGFAPF
jgi:rubrerythrin